MAAFVICGLEHSGTTMVSELFRQIPGVDAGFEVGVLLCDSPRGLPWLKPYDEIMLWGWGIDRAALEQCCDTHDFGVFYQRLRAASTVLNPDTRVMFDKTPRYGAALYDCIDKIGVHGIVVYKDPRATVYSDFKASGAAAFQPWFDAYAGEKIGYMRLHYAEYQRARRRADGRVCLVRLEDICLDTRRTCERMFAHVGQVFVPAYAALPSIRYANTRKGSVSAGIPFEYLTAFTPDIRHRIKDAFAEFSDWFYD
jgi:hypothetical protein